MMHGSSWAMGGMMVGWLALTVLVVALVVWLVAAYARPRSTGYPSGAADWETGTARRILADRYARGELDTEDYRQRLTALRG